MNTDTDPQPAPPFNIGDRVRILGGFEDGIEGVIVANEPMGPQPEIGANARPWRFRVRYEPCPYCGNGDCLGSARTANGRDVERWHAVHTSKRPKPGTIGGLHPFNLERIDA